CLFAVDAGERELGRRGGRQGLLDLRERVEVRRAVGQGAVGGHATADEIPYAVRVLVAIGVRVERERAGVAGALEQAHEQERLLEILRTEAEVLVVAPDPLRIEVDV